MRTLIIIISIGLTACNSTDRNAGKLTVRDTNQMAAQEQVMNDSSVLFLDTTVTSYFSGDTSEQIIRTLKIVSEFDQASLNFRKDTFLVYDKTTEGCEIIVVHNKTTKFIEFYGTLYGEMGEIEFKFYMLNGQYPKFSCVVFTQLFYDKPLYEKDMQIKETKTTYQIFSDNKLIALLDGQMKKQNLPSKELREIENDTRQFFKDYVGQIKIVK